MSGRSDRPSDGGPSGDGPAKETAEKNAAETKKAETDAAGTGEPIAKKAGTDSKTGSAGEPAEQAESTAPNAAPKRKSRKSSRKLPARSVRAKPKGEPSQRKSAARKSAPKKAAVAKSAAAKSTAAKPTAAKSSAAKPSTDKSSTAKSAADKSVADKSVADKTAEDTTPGTGEAAEAAPETKVKATAGPRLRVTPTIRRTPKDGDRAKTKDDTAEDAAAAGKAQEPEEAEPDAKNGKAPTVEKGDRISQPVTVFETEPRRRSRGWTWLLLLLVICGGGYYAWSQGLLSPYLPGPQQAAAPEEAVETPEAPQDPAPPPSQAEATEASEPPDPAETAAATESDESAMSEQQAAAPTLNEGELASLESMLEKLAFDPGAVDGEIDDQTRDAIRQFQEFAGLPVDGEPSSALLEELNEVLKMMGE